METITEAERDRKNLDEYVSLLKETVRGQERVRELRRTLFGEDDELRLLTRTEHLAGKKVLKEVLTGEGDGLYLLVGETDAELELVLVLAAFDELRLSNVKVPKRIGLHVDVNWLLVRFGVFTQSEADEAFGKVLEEEKARQEEFERFKKEHLAEDEKDEAQN